jgi:hypothetical protein
MLRALFFSALLFVVPAASTSNAANGGPEQCRSMISSAPRADRSARPSDLDFSVAYSAAPSAVGARVRWTLTLRNRARKSVGLTFPTSQYADVVVRQGGEVKYRWSSRRGFFQAFTGRTLGPRSVYKCYLGPDRLDLEPGRYEVIAYLTSTTRVFLRRALIVRG